MVFDTGSAGDAHALERLRTDMIGWLTTVRSDGQPQTFPIWFLWDDGRDPRLQRPACEAQREHRHEREGLVPPRRQPNRRRHRHRRGRRPHRRRHAAAGGQPGVQREVRRLDPGHVHDRGGVHLRLQRAAADPTDSRARLRRVSRRARVAVAAGAALAGVAAAGPALDRLVGRVEDRMNPVGPGSDRPASPRAIELHATLRVADLHADSLLWGRDLLRRGTRGAVDVPRLIEGNIALQVLSMPVKTPRGLNIERNADTSDNVLAIALAKRWPRTTWTRLLPRIEYLAARAYALEDASRGAFRVVGLPSRPRRLPRGPRGARPDDGRAALDRGRARARR